MSGAVVPGGAGYYCTKMSQDAIAAYRPIFEARQVALHTRGIAPVFHSLEDAI